MPLIKGLGMTIYLSNDARTTTSISYTAVCAVSIDGGGIETSSTELEPCLDDLLVYDYPGNPKWAQVTIDYKKEEIGADTSGSTTTTITTLMEDSGQIAQICAYGIKIPSVTPLYASRTAYVISQIDGSKERNQDTRTTLILAPQSDWTISTTALA